MLKQLEREQTDTHTDRQTDRQTDTQDNYSNPRVCAPRVILPFFFAELRHQHIQGSTASMCKKKKGQWPT